MQADPFIQTPSDTQMYNRYSYVRNNPLNATDPSGYFIFSLAAIALTATKTVTGFWAVVGTFAAAGFGDAMIQGASVKQALKSGLISGVSAAAFYGIGEYFSGLEGANQAAALKRNLQFLDRTSAYMQASNVGLTTAQSLGKIAAHGVAGGAMSVLGGGKFGHGFAAAGLTQAAGGQIGRIGGGSTATGPTLARIAAASVLGGSVSKLTGGKFANGAITGAFSRAINDELHFDGEKLSWLDDDGKVLEEWEAVSGRAGSQSPDLQAEENLGPIPEGRWSVAQSEYQFIGEGGRSVFDVFVGEVGRGAWPGGVTSWGKHRVWVSPLDGTNTYGRSGFSIHGGISPGSAGCIDLTLQMDGFANRFKNYGKDLTLTVSY